MIPLLRKTVAAVLLLTLALAAAVLVRTLGARSRQVVPATARPLNLDRQAAVGRLSALVRLPTVSWGDASRRDVKAFDDVRPLLAASFPRVHQALTVEPIARWSLLCTWHGRRSDLPPILLTAHLDVVPVEAGSEHQWTHPPFDGDVADGSIWGRGTIDDKSAVAGLLEATEALLATGFTPARTVYLAITHNEEGGGDPSGAAAIAATLAARGVHHAWLLDEGGLISKQIPGVAEPVAFIGVAEKGYLDLHVVAHSSGGHSSMPPEETAIGILAGALDRIEHNQMPARLDGASERMFQTLAPDMSFGMRAVFANLWLTRPLVVRLLSARPQTNALVRTTTAPTVLESGSKANVLPLTATATVNFRLLPGDTAESIEEHVRRVVNDDRVEIRRAGESVEATFTSPSDSADFAALAQSVRSIYPNVLVAPYLTVAKTDTREYVNVADSQYRFLPVYQEGALEMIHGVNEHVTIDAYEKAVRIYATLIAEISK